MNNTLEQTKTIEELTQKLAIHSHDRWKEAIHPLLIGDHLSELKRIQYTKGMGNFNHLEPYYQNTYTQDALEIITLCLEYIDVLKEASQ